MKLAVIDIGSNGARMLINRIINKKDIPSLKSVEYVRFPLRLGKDVFTKNRIGKVKEENLIKLMRAFKLLMELHQVQDSLIFATSALREAQNGEEIIKKVEEEVGLRIDVIDGKKEAEFINYVISNVVSKNYNYLHVDVGGGSTELNFYAKNQKVASQSFAVGSIRNAQRMQFLDKMLNMKKWIKKYVLSDNDAEIIAIATGGNMNKISKLLNADVDELIPVEKIKNLRSKLAVMSISDRIHKLKLNPDRADTIVPASDIYLNAIKTAEATQVIAPNIGLKDGMMQYLLEKNMSKFLQNQKVSVY